MKRYLIGAVLALGLGGAVVAQDRRQPVSDLEYVRVQAGDSYWSLTRDLGLSCTHTELWAANGRQPLDPGTIVLLPPWCTAPVASTTTSTTSTTTSTTVAPTTTAPAQPLDALLVPTDPTKVLLGSSFGSGSLGATQSFESIVGRVPPIAHQYATSPTQFQSRINSTPAGSIPFVNIKPLGTMGGATYRRILAGDADANLTQIATSIRNYGRPMFVAVMHEPENDGPAADDADYARAYRYSVQFMEAQGVTNAVWVWNMMGFYGHGARYPTLYPGDDVVDWIASDPYVRGSDICRFRGLANKTAPSAPGWPGFYAWAAVKGKPMMLAEWGIELQYIPAVPRCLLTQTEVTRMRAEMPQLRALVYWNSTTTANGAIANDYRLQHFPTEWRNFANLPNFQVDISAAAKR